MGMYGRIADLIADAAGSPRSIGVPQVDYPRASETKDCHRGHTVGFPLRAARVMSMDYCPRRSRCEERTGG